MANLECLDELQDIPGKRDLFAVARSIFPLHTDFKSVFIAKECNIETTVALISATWVASVSVLRWCYWSHSLPYLAILFVYFWQLCCLC